MTTNFLILSSWTLWTVLLVCAVGVAIKIFSENNTSPEASREVGIALVVGLLLFVGLIGAGVFWVTHTQSYTSLLILAIGLAYPTFAFLASTAFVSCRHLLTEIRNRSMKGEPDGYPHFHEAMDDHVVNAR